MRYVLLLPRLDYVTVAKVLSALRVSGWCFDWGDEVDGDYGVAFMRDCTALVCRAPR